MHDKLQPPEFMNAAVKARRPLRPVVVLCVIGIFILTTLSAVAVFRNPAFEALERSAMIHPDMLARATPVGAYAVYQGIRIELVATIFTSSGGVMYLTVEDLEGERLSGNRNMSMGSDFITHRDWYNEENPPEWVTPGGSSSGTFDEESGKHLEIIRFNSMPEDRDMLYLWVHNIHAWTQPRFIDTIFENGAWGIQAAQRRLGINWAGLTALANNLAALDRSGFTHVAHGDWVIPFAITPAVDASAIELRDVQVGDITASVAIDFFSMRYSADGNPAEFELELEMFDGTMHGITHGWKEIEYHPNGGWWWWEISEGLEWASSGRIGDDHVDVHIFFETPFDVAAIREIRMNGEVVWRAND